VLAVHDLRHRDRLDDYGPDVLPAFDAYVYAAMSESPAIFTLAPWGHRLLVPGLVALSPASPASTFRWLTPAALLAAGVLLFAWLRRLGFDDRLGLVAAAAFAALPPVSHAVSYSVLVEPVGVLLEMALLLALSAGAPMSVAALLLMLATATKEILLVLLLPVVFASRATGGRARRAAAESVAIAAPAVAWLLLVRMRWPAPGDDGSLPAPGPAMSALAATVGEWGLPLLLAGVLPLAAWGATRPAARPFLRTHAWLVVAGLALPFAAALYVPGAGAEPQFFAADVERLLIYPLPVLLALALFAFAAPRPDRILVARGATAAWVVAGLLALTPLALDGYRRLDLTGPRDGPRLLALTRGTRATAARLEAKRPVLWQFPSHGYVPVRMAPEYLDRTRWFLLQGWGPFPHYSLDPVVMREDRATLLLPLFDAMSTIDVVLNLSTTAPVALDVTANGTRVGRLELPAGASRHLVAIPPGPMYRGDNEVALQGTGAAAARVTLDVLQFRARP
jgi:hypothetical protein